MKSTVQHLNNTKANEKYGTMLKQYKNERKVRYSVGPVQERMNTTVQHCSITRMNKNMVQHWNIKKQMKNTAQHCSNTRKNESTVQHWNSTRKNEKYDTVLEQYKNK